MHDRDADVRLIRLELGGADRAQARLIERYLPLARGLAASYSRGVEPIDDLYQVACLGLVKAAQRWDPDRGFTFSTFAVPTIRGELRRHFRDATWQVRPPRALQELARSTEAARDELADAGGREPTTAAIAERLGRDPAEVDEALQAGQARGARSLDVVADEADGAPLSELIGDEDPGFARAEDRMLLEHLTSRLPRRTVQALLLRYGGDLLQREIAAHIGCSQMHVSRVLSRALDQLHDEALAA